MYNPFLNKDTHDTETALMLEKAFIHDIGKAVAFTDGKRVFINTPDNLEKILPAYDDNMLKWLLWHERIHLELKHHDRYFKWVDKWLENDESTASLSIEEVNIIMDILVHDWLSDKFPELVATAEANCAQFRDKNSLSHTFRTNTLEEMLKEYAETKTTDDKSGDSDQGDSDDKEPTEQPDTDSAPSHHKETDTPKESTPAKGRKEEDSEIATEQEQTPSKGRHEETDWSKLEDIDKEEFLREWEGRGLEDKINRLKSHKFNLIKLTKTLNGLITDKRLRSYKTPSYTFTGQSTIFKGHSKAKGRLFLCFDASGSMHSDMDMFKEIITKSIPQALTTPTTWFSGWISKDEMTPEQRRALHDSDGRNGDYFKGKFEDFVKVHASNGYVDDGDRTIEMCHKAEQEGYTPIGITDGGGRISWSIDMLKDLKRTILVGENEYWLNQAKEINPRIEIICTKIK